jgi:antitoxin component of RelBE/YafQ-DinJ toxin-antitoxin module
MINEQKIQLCIDALAADTADKLAKEAGLTITAALQIFMKTKTYELLFDEQSLLYLESAEYVYDMLEAEQRGDWERWREE